MGLQAYFFAWQDALFAFYELWAQSCLVMDKNSLLLKIKLRRVALGLSQEDVAKATNIDRSQYSRLERGDSDLSLTHLMAISDCLGMSFADFESDDKKLPEKGHEAPEGMQKEIESLRNQITELQSQIKNIISSPKQKKETPAIESVEANKKEFMKFLESNPADEEIEAFIKESVKALVKSVNKKK